MGEREQRRAPGASGHTSHSGGDEGPSHEHRVRVALMRRRAQQRAAGKSGEQQKPAEEAKRAEAPDDGLLEPASLKEGGAEGKSADLMQPDWNTPAVDGPPIPLPGEKGILTGEVSVKVGGKDTVLSSGTVVEVIGGANKLRVKVFSGHKGAEAEIAGNLFKPEPGVALGSDGKTEKDEVYQEYQGKLWDPKTGPTVGDIAQGGIGDCFLMAAMMGVCGREPGVIKRLFKTQAPNLKSYTITLYQGERRQDGSDGHHRRHHVAVGQGWRPSARVRPRQSAR
jgi:hypothetical protein